MANYIKVKQGTAAWDMFNDYWTFDRKWIENEKEIEKFLGFPMKKNLFLDVNTLTVERSAIPKDMETQFTKNSTPATVKKTSFLHKEWVKLCNKLNLRVIRSSDVCMSLHIYGSVSSMYPLMDGEYYLQTKIENSMAWDKVEDWSVFEWAEEIKESDFLRIRADWLEKNEKEKVSV